MVKSRTNEFESPYDWKNFTAYLNDKNRFVLIPYWKRFISRILKTAQKRTAIIKRDTKLLRARMGTTWVEFEDGDTQPTPLPPEQMGAPSKQLATDGRLNPFGISYLYLTTDTDTAIAELRPWIGSDVSVGLFKILKDSKVIDTTKDKSNPLHHLRFVIKDGKFVGIKQREPHSYTAEEKESQIWGDISSAFSIPVSPSDIKSKYLPTQYLSEVLKVAGYDGVIYRSSLNSKGKNIVLFDPSTAESVACRMFDVKGVNYLYNESGNPVQKSSNGKTVFQRVEIIGPADKSKTSVTNLKREKNAKRNPMEKANLKNT